jgi:hypothetical protein
LDALAAHLQTFTRHVKGRVRRLAKLSAKIGVLHPADDPQSLEPRYRVKRCVALSLVRKNLAEWVSKSMIRLRKLMDFRTGQSDSSRFLRSCGIERGPWDGGQLKPPRKPETLLIYYPIADQRS